MLLLIAGLTVASSVTHAAEGGAPSKAPAAPKELPPASTKTGLTFDKDIKPLFEASCVRCHGAQNPKGKLQLHTLAGFKAGSEDGAVYKEGDSANSTIVKAIARINPRTAMPPEPRGPRRGPGGPGGAGAPPAGNAPNAAATPPAAPAGGPGGPGNLPPPKPLTAEEVGLVRAWIDQGAK